MSITKENFSGSKSDKVAFVGVLVNPNKPIYIVHNEGSTLSYFIVGYAFKALEDMTVPRADIKSGFRNFMDVGRMTEENIKEGEVFYLNIFETVALISKSVYDGKICGNGIEVRFDTKVFESLTEENVQIPLPLLTRTDGKPIDESKIFIADMIGANPDKGIIGTPRIKDEFAQKFSVIYENRIGNQAQKNVQHMKDNNNLEDIFLKYIQSKQ